MTNDNSVGALKPYILSVIVTDESGALARVLGVLIGKGYNLESIAVASINKKVSRITIVCLAPASDRRVITQAMHQINKLVPVVRVRDLTDDPGRVDVRFALLRVDTSDKRKRGEATLIAKKAGAHMLKVDHRFVTFVYNEPNLESFQKLAKALSKFGNVAVARSGLTSLGGRATIHQVM